MSRTTLIPKKLILATAALLFCFNVAGQDKVNLQNQVYPKGEKGPADRFTGAVWIHPMVSQEDKLDCTIANVTFEPGARTNWHIHVGGQALLVSEGKGYYQERGKPVRVIQKGDVVKCTPNVEHWHGATPESGLTHIAIVTNVEKGDTKWLQKVSDEEYGGK